MKGTKGDQRGANNKRGTYFVASSSPSVWSDVFTGTACVSCITLGHNVGICIAIH